MEEEEGGDGGREKEGKRREEEMGREERPGPQKFGLEPALQSPAVSGGALYGAVTRLTALYSRDS